MIDKKKFAEKNTMLVQEFDRYIQEFPDFSDKLPNNGTKACPFTDRKIKA
jgi:hypothetical protein